ncbi:MAG: DNA translocase FtsK [Acidobacteriota bacterium]|nr:DNA translocase FtsK [Acidobacteriota bacterium]
MASISTEARGRTATSAARNTRRNEIVAIGLLALSALLTLCLLSYHPNDPSWNAVGETDARNMVGSIGANVAAALLQAVGLAAALLPLLLIATAWRRFRTRRIHAPLSRIIGLVVLLLAAASLLALSPIKPLADASFQPGGMVGAVISGVLVHGMNTIGASVLLVALAATGVLFATNFSFALAYERIIARLGDPSALVPALVRRFHEWRAKRRQHAVLRAEHEQELLKANQSNAVDELHPDGLRSRDMLSRRESAQAKEGAASVTAIKRAAVTGSHPSPEAEVRAKLAQAEAELASIVARPSADSIAEPPPAALTLVERARTPLPKRTLSAVPTPATMPPAASVAGRPLSDAKDKNTQGKTDAEIEEMMRTAAVVRTDIDEDEASIEPVARPAEIAAARRAEKLAAAMSNYKFPNVEFLRPAPPRHEQADEELLGLAMHLAEKCKEFNVTGQIKHICPGPVVTTYEFKPDPGVKYSRVTGLVDDLCLALKAESIRIDRVPGKPHVGIEVPNPHRETIHLREVIESTKFIEPTSKLTIALGKTIDGLNYVADLAKMPHLLIAGATGAGKSVGVNTLIVSILYKARPDEVKFIMVDPKRLELGLYADIPHLATPIITDPKRATQSLKWAVGEMEKRYKDLAGWGVRNIDGYNTEITRRNAVEDFDEEGRPWKPLPYIVIIIDELADLMMVSGHEVEESITRLAQMARAVGIHLVLATQRPSVDVITGLIKANFPSRVAYRVSSKVDSRTIIDSNGAEQLLGRGDMLFLPPGTSRLVRVHGAYVDEEEIGKIVKHVKEQGEPTYDESITQSEEEASGTNGTGGERDELFEQALRICVEMKRASTSVLQRRLRVGYGRAAAILDAMERDGFIGQADGARPRAVLGRAYETIDHWDSLQNDAGA